jgi:hypothetical protein
VQLRRSPFIFLDRLSAITIPASITHIHNDAFESCWCLCSVTFEYPSECW